MQSEMVIVAGSSHPELAEAICDQLGMTVAPSHLVRFANENLMVQIDENVREADVFVIQTSRPPVSDGILELLITIDALRHASAARVTAVVPYFPYARSDKKDRPRISITARLMADLLESAGASRVLTMDLHAPQVQGFFRVPADNLLASSLLCDHLADTRDLSNSVLVAGDVGESKDVGRYARRLNLPIAIVDKRRDGDDDRAVATSLIGDVEGKDAILVDDEVATGGTLIEAARFCLERGARRVEAAVVHPVLSGDAVKRIADSPIETLVATDSVPIPLEKRGDWLEIVSVAPLLADAIRAIHTGSSVSALFT
jgi:ribose-phosphate pyrophosphokinase